MNIDRSSSKKRLVIVILCRSSLQFLFGHRHLVLVFSNFNIHVPCNSKLKLNTGSKVKGTKPANSASRGRLRKGKWQKVDLFNYRDTNGVIPEEVLTASTTTNCLPHCLRLVASHVTKKIGRRVAMMSRGPLFLTGSVITHQRRLRQHHHAHYRPGAAWLWHGVHRTDSLNLFI